MKYLLATGILLAHVYSFAQDTLPQRRAGDNTFTFAVERGGTVDFDGSIITINSRTELKEHASYGLSAGYARSFPLGKRSDLVLGIGANTTIFSSQVIYRNRDMILSFSPDTVHARPMSSHDLGKIRNAYFALDLQVLYALKFATRNKWAIIPFAGVKLRNVVYIRGEQRNLYRSTTTREINGTDTVFYMQPSTSYRMRDSRIVVMPTIGVNVEKPLTNGGKLGFFADYSYAISNTLQIDYKNLSNTEKFEITSQNSPTYYQTIEIEYANSYPLVLALNMSHIRVGISYTLPAR
jgi:hypothetical protein